MPALRPKCPRCGARMTRLGEATKPYKRGYRWACTKCGYKMK